MKSTRLAWAAAISCALVLTACGGSSDSDGGGGTDAASGDVTATDIATALEYTGGEEGKADSSLEPFLVGFANAQGGVPAFPEQEKAADAAVDFVNNHLGGIDGHPLKLEKCFMNAEEDGQKCAAQFLDKDVKIANVGTVVYGNAPFYKLINGKFPVVVSVGTTAADTSSEHVYGLDGGAIANLLGMAVNAKKNGPKISIVSSNNPAAKFLMDEAILPFMKSIGLEETTAYVADTATTPDFVSAIQNNGAKDADTIYLLNSSVGMCVSLYDAMKQISVAKPVVAPSQCSADPMPEKTGGGPEGWSITGLTDPPFISTPQVDVINHGMKAAGVLDALNQGFASKVFGDILSITKFAKAVGYDKATPQLLEDQILAFRGPAWTVPGTIECGSNKVSISVCGNASTNYTFTDGKWKTLEPYVPTAS
ncbi:hypothetical protein BH09ACT10_BH09ACT10_20330 [soil metagenome]